MWPAIAWPTSEPRKRTPKKRPSEFSRKKRRTSVVGQADDDEVGEPERNHGRVDPKHRAHGAKVALGPVVSPAARAAAPVREPPPLLRGPEPSQVSSAFDPEERVAPL